MFCGDVVPPNLDEVWTEAIKPAIEIAGFDPHRIDRTPHNERIDVKIIFYLWTLDARSAKTFCVGTH